MGAVPRGFLGGGAKEERPLEPQWAHASVDATVGTAPPFKSFLFWWWVEPEDASQHGCGRERERSFVSH